MTPLPVYRLCRACVAVTVLFTTRTLTAANNTPACTSLTISREFRRVGRVQLLVDNRYVYGAHDSELGNCTDIVNGRQPYVTRAAAVRQRGRVTDRAPTTTVRHYDDRTGFERRRRALERRRRVRTPKRPVQNDGNVRNDLAFQSDRTVRNDVAIPFNEVAA